MTRLTDYVLRHKRLVLLVWLVIAVAGFATVGKATSALSTNFDIPGQAFKTDSTIVSLYHNGGDQNPPVVLTATLPPGTAAGTATVAEADRLFAAAARSVPGSRLADQATTGDAGLSGAAGSTQFALVFAPPKMGFSGPDPAKPMGQALAATAPAGWRTGVTGLAQLQAGTGGGQGSSALTEVLLGGLGALLVLAFVFASFIAVLPLLMAAAAIPTTFLLVYGLTRLTAVNFIVQFLIALIGLGVAIDYSLLVVTRWREERANGLENEPAVAAAMNTAGRAVVFSGVTVAISLLALVALPVAFLRGMGLAAFFIPLTAVAVAVTLLPVLLATIGPKVDRPRLRREVHASRAWTGWARLVLRHRVSAFASGVVLIGVLFVPLFSLHLGQPPSKVLALGSPEQATLSQLESSGVPSGIISPIDVLTTADQTEAVAGQVRRIPGVYTAFAAVENPPVANTGLVEILPVAEPSSAAGAATVNAVRHALAGQSGVIGVGGQGASEADFIHAVYGNFPLMLTLIALVTLILLTRALRSLVLAVKAVVFNLASVGVAYGVMVLIWQWGHGSHVLWSVPATGSITVWVPLMVFAFLFGLSMDYEVFILSRIREEYDATGSTDEAVVRGLGRTGRLVTSAALILFLAFLALSSNPETDVKMLATGLGAGILLDAVVIRSLLVPSLIGVLGRWNWWLPASAARILRIAPSPAVVEPVARDHQPT